MMAPIAVKERKLHRYAGPHLHVDHVGEAKAQAVHVEALCRLHVAHIEHDMAEALIAHEKSFYPGRRYHRRFGSFSGAEVDLDLDPVRLGYRGQSGNTAPLGNRTI